MARSSGTSVENSFVKGLLTEYSGFNFPENACVETQNCVFTPKGSVVRRLGLELEDTESPSVISYSGDSVFSSFVWRSAGFQSEDNFLVQQIGGTLHFYQLISDNIADNKTSFTLALDDFKSGGDPALNECQFSNGAGRLFVSNPDTDTFFVRYNPDTDNIETTVIEVKIRDFKVLPDGYDIDESPTFATSNIEEFQYNIRNQGWTTPLITAWQNQGNSAYPTKGQVWWYFRDANAASLYPAFLNFLPVHRYKFQDLGVSLAPRGTFILDAYNQDRSAVSGISGLASQNSRGKRASCLAFINGRVFLSGVDADGYNGVVYFSNILKDVDTDIRFYQNGDPSSEVNPQLLPNDGGTFIIPDAGKIIRMIPVKNTLIIFATNGLWAVQGSEAVGFSATDFSIEKISDEPCVSNSSYTIVSNTPVWWTKEGIFTLNSSQGGSLSSENISSTTIQSFYDEIPVASKLYVKSGFNSLTKEIFWLYSNEVGEPTLYNRVLVLNVKTQAFYVHTLPTSIKIVDLVTPMIISSTYSEENVTDSTGDTVVDSTLANVTATVTNFYNPDDLGNVKFTVTYDTNKVGFAKFSNVNLIDWEDLDDPGTSYTSYFVTGPRVRGESLRTFQENYLTVFSQYRENSSCYVYAMWDYGNNTNSNRWGTPQQAIKSTGNFDYSVRRLQIRGSGKAVQFKFESESNKPFIIAGWAGFETVDQNV